MPYRMRPGTCFRGTSLFYIINAYSSSSRRSRCFGSTDWIWRGKELERRSFSFEILAMPFTRCTGDTHEQSLSYEQYLNRPEMWPDHFPEMFGLPAPETWALFVAFWNAAIPLDRLHVVRFEDVKADGESELAKVLSFLGIQRAESEIASAVLASGFEKAKAAMEQREQQTKERFLVARRGAVGEWKQSHSEAQLARFSGLCNSTMVKFGYEPVLAAQSVEMTETENSDKAEKIIQIFVSKLAPDWPSLRDVLHLAFQNLPNSRSLALGYLVASWMSLVFRDATCPCTSPATIFFRLHDMLREIPERRFKPDLLGHYRI